jgi:hypothetical protein
MQGLGQRISSRQLVDVPLESGSKLKSVVTRETYPQTPESNLRGIGIHRLKLKYFRDLHM